MDPGYAIHPGVLSPDEGRALEGIGTGRGGSRHLHHPARRVLHIEYVQTFDLAPGVRLAVR